MRTTDRIFDLDLVDPSRRISWAERPTRLLNVIRGAVGAFRNRLAANRLADLDDSLLADLGLSRGEINEVLRTHGLFDDPSLRLRQLARNRAERSLLRQRFA